MIIRCALLIVVAAAAGCTGLSTLSRTHADPPYTPSLVHHMAASGRVPTAIYGQPFAGDKTASDEAVISALRLPGFFTPAPFEITPDALAGAGPRVVLIFDPATFPGADAACTTPDDVGLTPSASSFGVAAAFCYGEAPISQAYLGTDRPSRPGDPQFRQAMGQLMAGLFPSQDPNRDDGAELPE